MEQKPIGAAEPLEPPTVDVARAYLDEVGVVGQRREARIDRRMLGWLHMIDGLVVGALFSVALLVMRSSPPVGYLWLLVVFALMTWTEFAGELRDRLGVRPHWFRSWSLPYLLVFVPTVIIAWSASLAPDSSVFLAVIPFAVSVLVFGALAVRQWRRAEWRASSGVPARAEQFTRRAAVVTAVVGMMLGALVFVAAGVTEPMTANVIGGILLGALVAFTIAMQTGSWMPVLGRSWLWPQWTALAFAGVLFLATLVLGASARIVTIPTAFVMGASVFALFMVVSVWGVRHSAVSDPQREPEFGASS